MHEFRPPCFTRVLNVVGGLLNSVLENTDNRALDKARGCETQAKAAEVVIAFGKGHQSCTMIHLERNRWDFAKGESEKEGSNWVPVNVFDGLETPVFKTPPT